MRDDMSRIDQPSALSPQPLLTDEISRVDREFLEALENANASAALDEIRVRYFGRKGGVVPALFTRLK